MEETRRRENRLSTKGSGDVGRRKMQSMKYDEAALKYIPKRREVITVNKEREKEGQTEGRR